MMKILNYFGPIWWIKKTELDVADPKLPRKDSYLIFIIPKVQMTVQIQITKVQVQITMIIQKHLIFISVVFRNLW